MKTVIVIPHHLPTLEFLNEWKQEFANKDTQIIIVNDRDYEIKEWPDWDGAGHIQVYTHADIDRELGKDSWIIPRGTSAIRSFGLYKAWQMKPEMIITLDNDCFPDRKGEYFIKGHQSNLDSGTTLDWVKSTPRSFLNKKTRGFPYKIRNKAQTYISHGVWSKIPDLDAAQMLLYSGMRTQPASKDEIITIPRFNFYPQCSMNLAFRPEATPLLYHGLFGSEYGFDQFDDIWAGIFSKKVLDHLGFAVRSGYPSVEHRKQSDAFSNFRKQAGGLEWNEELWEIVQDINIEGDNPIDCYKSLIYKLSRRLFFEEPYFKKMLKAMGIWIDLFI